MSEQPKGMLTGLSHRLSLRRWSRAARHAKDTQLSTLREQRAAARKLRQKLDQVIHVADENVMFTGDIVEYHSACYCGDGYFNEWGDTLDAIKWFDVDAIAPGRGDALVGKEMVNAAIENTRDFVESTYRPAAKVAARNGSLKEAWDAVREACDPKFSDYAIYEHCLPFNVSRAYDEARGIEHPRIWTAQRDIEMWEALQG